MAATARALPAVARPRLLAACAVLLVITALPLAPVRAYVPPGSGALSIGSEYLALGDSLARGVGSSTCPIGCAGRAGYVADFARRLERAAGHAVSVRDLGVSGETTASFIGNYFTNTGSRSQLARAVAAIRDHGAAIGPVTLDIGGNDALDVRGPDHTAAEKLTALATIRSNLETIVATLQRELQTAGSPADVVLLAYYDPFGDDDPDLWAMALLNQTIRDVGAEYGLRVAEPYAAFVGVEQQTTWMACGCVIDIHPNDRGYALLGDALAAVTIAQPPPAGSLGGVVRDPSGAPIAGARVWYGGASVATGADGSYRLDSVPAGVALHVEAGASAGRADATAIVTLRPGALAIQNFVLDGTSDGGSAPAEGDTHGIAGFARIGAAIARAAARAAAEGARARAAAGVDAARAGVEGLAGRAAAGIERLRQLPFP
jgi:lysophospholipase L1-like esterase